MKTIKLTITENYVAHWSWWQGVRELLQNAVDTGDYSVHFAQQSIEIISRGGKIPISALLLGKSTKTDDDSTIGKFGEGMKLGFLVLKRLGAGITMNNEGDLWIPDMVMDEDFGERCLAVNIHEGAGQVTGGAVSILISNIPSEALEEIRTKFAPCQELEVEIENSRGKAYKKGRHRAGCRLFVKGIFVTEVPGNFKFDYDFQPHAFVLDRDRDTASTFEVKYEASKLLSESPDILLLAQLATENYDDLAEFRGRFNSYSRGRSQGYYEDDEPREETLQEKAAELFTEKHGDDAFPINDSWDDRKKRLVTDQAIKNGYSPVVVKNPLYVMVEEEFHLDAVIEEMLNFKPLVFLTKFRDKHKRTLKAKAAKELDRTIEMLQLIEKK